MNDDLDEVKLTRLLDLCARYDDLGESIDQLQHQGDELEVARAFAERAYVSVLIANLWPLGERARAAWQRQRRADQVRAHRSAGRTPAEHLRVAS